MEFSSEQISTAVFGLVVVTVVVFTILMAYLFFKSGEKLKPGEKLMYIMLIIGFLFAILFAAASLLFKVYI